jgi:uncharacterized protein YjbJ (UPF0337 family)
VTLDRRPWFFGTPVANHLGGLSASGSNKSVTGADGKMADDLNTDGLENQAKGLGKQAEGKIRNAVGGLTGDSSEQLKGKAQDLKGKAQRKIGEAEQDLDD